MQITIDEREQAHLYSCLLVGNAEFLKVKKSLAKLNREDEAIDDEIARNAELRRIFNPRAEEEARERSRAKDPSQMDLTEAGSSGETGGGTPAGQTFSLKTPAEMTDDELRDALLAIGFTVSLEDLENWPQEEFEAVAAWAGEVVAARINDCAVPDEPECLAVRAMSNERVAELLAAGPYTVTDASEEVGRPSFDVSIPETDAEEALVDDSFDDKIDAELRAARLNLNALRTSDMSEKDVQAFAAAGPWGIVLEGENYFIVAGTQRETCDSEADAFGRAARYNRSIAQRKEVDEWANEPQRVVPSEDADVPVAATASAD